MQDAPSDRPVNQLDAWVRANLGGKYSDFAEKIGVTYTSAYRMCRGLQGASRETLEKIEALTDGAINYYNFNAPAEAA